MQSTNETADEDEPAAGGAGTGAGTGTDANLYGATSEAAGEAGDTFELGIAARVRGRRAAPGPVPGEAPPADPDAKPKLAPDQHAETAVHHMAVPAAYETLVREVFAHRDAAAGGAP